MSYELFVYSGFCSTICCNLIISVERIIYCKTTEAYNILTMLNLRNMFLKS